MPSLFRPCSFKQECLDDSPIRNISEEDADVPIETQIWYGQDSVCFGTYFDCPQWKPINIPGDANPDGRPPVPEDPVEPKPKEPKPKPPAIPKPPTPPKPPNHPFEPPTPVGRFYSAYQQCSVLCSNGTLYTAVLAAGGATSNISQADANARGYAKACSNANNFKMCFGSITSKWCVNSYYNQTIPVTGHNPVYWSISQGFLPDGLVFVGGNISGVPTTAGIFNFTVLGVDIGSNYSVRNYTIRIVDISNTALADGTILVPYSDTLTAVGAFTPHTWSIVSGTLPTGLTLDANTGVISGTPAHGTSGTTTLVVSLTDSEIVCQKSLTIKINGQHIDITCPKDTGTTTFLYSSTITATGGVGPYSFTIASGDLPAGLLLDGATGIVSGVPAVPGVYAFTIGVSDSDTPINTGTQDCEITINDGGDGTARWDQ